MQVKIKKILGNGIFLLGLFLILNLTSIIFQPKNNSQEAGMEDVTANGILGEPEQTIDVLFLSDSVGYCSIIPLQIWRDYGITSYVCGTPLQPLYYSIEFLEKAFKTQSPKVVVLETMPIFNEFKEKEALKNRMEQFFPVFRYHDRWKQPKNFLTEDMTLNIDYTHIVRDKGYHYYRAVDEPVHDGNFEMVSDVAQISEACKDAVAKIKEICDDHGAQLVLIGAPNVVSWRADRYNAVARLAMELEVAYYETNFMREEVPINWETDAFDGGEHLNYKGAQKFTVFLGKYLDGLGIFEDKHNQEEYAAWNQNQKEFYDSVTE